MAAITCLCQSCPLWSNSDRIRLIKRRAPVPPSDSSINKSFRLGGMSFIPWTFCCITYFSLCWLIAQWLQSFLRQNEIMALTEKKVFFILDVLLKGFDAFLLLLMHLIMTTWDFSMNCITMLFSSSFLTMLWMLAVMLSRSLTEAAY